jgi:hypothetical protein
VRNPKQFGDQPNLRHIEVAFCRALILQWRRLGLPAGGRGGAFRRATGGLMGCPRGVATPSATSPSGRRPALRQRRPSEKAAIHEVAHAEKAAPRRSGPRRRRPTIV